MKSLLNGITSMTNKSVPGGPLKTQSVPIYSCAIFLQRMRKIQNPFHKEET